MGAPWEPGRLTRAVKAPFPASPRPQLATLSKEVPAGNDWLHEIKYDGYRLLCSIQDGRARLFSRGGLDWTEKLSRLASSARELPAREAVLDGEIVILRPDGRSDFQALQKTIGGANPSGLVYYLFDVLYGDGYDLRMAPVIERKELLRSLLEGIPPDRLRFSDHVRGHGAAVLERACALGAGNRLQARLEHLRAAADAHLAEDQMRSPAGVRRRRLHRPRGLPHCLRRSASRGVRRRGATGLRRPGGDGLQ
jgi:bifunctional non-homologous end joining protein LigD